jgi:hypothetical protein
MKKERLNGRRAAVRNAVQLRGQRCARLSRRDALIDDLTAHRFVLE